MDPSLDELSQDAHFRGDHQEAIRLRERAFAAHERAGRRAEAAAAARWLAFLHGGVHGNRAAARGWMALAERLLEDLEESVEHGRLAADGAAWTDDPRERERRAARALDIARRFGDRDLEYSAQALLGHARVLRGRVDEGMALIDEAMAAVAGGAVVQVEAIGEIYCRLLGACERAGDLPRAEQWLPSARRFVAWGDFVAPTCRMHYGGILVRAGRWDEAERELAAALRAFEAGYRGMRAAPLIRLAALRVRQGRLEEAERLVEGLEARPQARLVLAEIALARGDAPLARDLARVALDGLAPGAPDRRPVLELLVQAHVTLDERESAREALVALAALGGRAGGGQALAEGRVLAAEGDSRAAARVQAATEAFAAAQMPFEAACAQMELARLVSATAPAAAVAEARAALGAFERLGAERHADAAAALLRSLGARAARSGPRDLGLLTKREAEVLELLALGLSNPEIAERLYLSRKTVQHHVAHVLAKLGLRSRAEAAAYAVRERAAR